MRHAKVLIKKRNIYANESQEDAIKASSFLKVMAQFCYYDMG